MREEEIIKLIEESNDNYDFAFSVSVENEAPDDRLQKLIEDRLIAAERKAEAANDRMIRYNEALDNAKSAIDKLKAEIKECQSNIDADTKIITHEKSEINKNRGLLTIKEQDNRDIFKLYRGVKGRDYLTEARSFMLKHKKKDYENLKIGESYSVVEVLDSSADMDYIMKEIGIMNDLYIAISMSVSTINKLEKEQRSLINERHELERELNLKRSLYENLKKTYPYRSISVSNIDTNIYIDSVDFSRTLKDAFNCCTGSGILHGIKL